MRFSVIIAYMYKIVIWNIVVFYQYLATIYINVYTIDTRSELVNKLHLLICVRTNVNTDFYAPLYTILFKVYIGCMA